MKKNLCVLSIVIIAILLESLNCFAQSGWQTLNSGTTRVLKGLFFLNEQVGWVCGEGGLIKKTTDGGNTWLTQRDGGNYLYNIQFIDENLGFAIGGGDPPPTSPALLMTNDGGTSWISLNSTSYYSLVGLFFLNSQVGWITGYSGTVRKTTNGGQTWFTQTTPGGYWFHDIQFINENIGWICGEGSKIYKTTDGGATWISQDNHSYSYAHWTKISIVDENNLYITGYMGSGGGKIIKTTNSGATWNVIFEDNTDAYSCVNFINQYSGWVTSWYGNILPTNDGGVNWDKQSVSSYGLNKIQMLNENSGYAVGYNGTIIKFQNIDTIPPSISVQIIPSKLYELWPPNHKMWTITAVVNASDNQPGVSYILKSIVSSEADSGLGFDDLGNDIQNADFGTPDLAFDLRAERYGTGIGRTYTITYEAADAAGNKTEAVVLINVYHSQSQNDGETDVKEQIEKSSSLVNIFPNPTEGKLTIKKETLSIERFTVKNLLGKIVLEGIINGNENTIDIKNFPVGVYIISVGNVSISILKL